MENKEESTEVLKRTPLYDEHIKLGAKMVAFAGWEMPIQYSSLKEEHINVRTNLGLFDVSHMGEIFFRGDKAVESLEFMTTNHVAGLEEGRAQYSLIPNEQGGIVDDIIVYCIKKNQEYLVCVNASNIEKDYQHFLKYNKGADISNESDDWAQIAVQGPKSLPVLEKVLACKIESLAPFSFLKLKYKNQEIIVAKTGYTGETGVEIFIPNKSAAFLWQELLEMGKAEGAMPIGLGARDTLRLEKKFPLYGNEINDETNPYEAGLGWVVKPQQGDFLGKDKIVDYKEKGLQKRLVGLKLQDKGIARQGYEVFLGEEKVGIVTSGSLSPSLNEAIAIAYVKSSLNEIGTELSIDIRGRKAKALVVKTPFV